MPILNSVLLLALAGIVSCVPILNVDGAFPPQSESSVRAALEALGKSLGDLRKPGSVPNPQFKPGTDLLPEIEYFVMIQLENHSFDNLFGLLERDDYDGLKIDPRTGKPSATAKYANGTIQHAFAMPRTCQNDQPTQNWISSHLQYDNGSMDGWVTAGGYKPAAMGYFTNQQLPFLNSLANTLPIGDRFFCSVLGQTWANRKYLIAATSLGDVNTGQAVPDQTPAAGTIFQMLSKFNISWANYAAPYASTLRLFSDANTTLVGHSQPMEQFFTDALAGNLPAFSFIDENGTFNSGENPQNIVNMESLMFDVVNAVVKGPKWEKTMLIFNWDEHGGYSDHVPPPPCLAPDAIAPVIPAGGLEWDGFRRCGFRVPAVVVSPYGKRNHVSHVVYDQTSIMATLQRKWNLPALTWRDANAHDMLDFIDLDALKERAMTFSNLESMKLLSPGNTTEALQCSVTMDLGEIPPLDSVEVPR